MCPLYRDATQTVFGAGPGPAALMLVGEQPGDAEDQAGEPFVGPAGRLLDRALEQAGVSRADAYVTNVVKHFKFKRQGKRRIHQTPRSEEIRACRPWFAAELDLVRPTVITALGATAAKALLGSSFRLTAHRGEVLDYQGRALVATTHPSAVLRMPDSTARAEAFDALVEDLRLAAKVAADAGARLAPVDELDNSGI
jgi:uracil-DNA glycosylase family protein